MGIRVGSTCYYVNQQRRVIAATTVTTEQSDGSITIKYAPSFLPVVVRAIDVFNSANAANRAALKPSPGTGTFIR